MPQSREEDTLNRWGDKARDDLVAAMERQKFAEAYWGGKIPKYGDPNWKDFTDKLAKWRSMGMPMPKPTPTPAPSPSPTPSPTPSPLPSPTPSPTPGPVSFLGGADPLIQRLLQQKAWMG